MNDVTKDLLEALEELVAEFGVCGLTEKARAAIARAEAALAEPQPDAVPAMTRDDVIRMAREAGFTWEPINNIVGPLERLVEQARIKERKGILDGIITKYLKCDCGLLTPKENKCVKLIVKRIDADIRARNKKL